MTNQTLLPNSSTYFVAQEISFSQWCEKVNFHRQKFSQNKAVTWLLYCEDGFEFSVLFFALLTANKKIILPQNGTVNQLKQCLEFAQGFAGRAELTCENHIDYCFDGSTKVEQALTINPALPLILFTSGSTGQAKAIEKTFQQLLKEIEQLEHCFANLIAGGCFLSTVSHQHIYGLLVKLLWPIWFGRNVILQPYEYPEHLCHDVHKYGVEKIVLVSSPAHFHRLVKDNVYLGLANQFTCCFSSGGPLNEAASRQLGQELGQSPIEIFGSTETGGIAWRQRNKEENPFWQPFNDVHIKQHQQSQCLMLKSPYFEYQGWYQTDDRIEIRNNGQFELCGRVDRIVKIEEKRVSLDQVQQCLKALPFIDDGYCLVKENKRGLQVVALVVLTRDAQLELEQSRNLVFNRKIKQQLSESLEAIAIPKRFRYLSALPYNSSGKLNRLALEKFFD